MRAVKSITRREHRLRCSRLCYTLFSCSDCCFAFHSAYSRCVPVYGRRRVLLNRGWSLGEEEDHHNGGRKARGSGQNRDAGPKPLSGGSAHQPDTHHTGCGCQQGDPQPLPQPRKLIEPSHINCPPSLRTACFNSSRSWSSGWVRARSKFRISPSRLGAGLGCCFIFSYRSRTAMGILPWHI